MLLDGISQFASGELNGSLTDHPNPTGPAFLEDVFLPVDRDSAHSTPSTSNTHPFNENDVSDIPRIRTTHVSAGYRDGIAASKGSHIQEGFDEGYALGAEIGTRVGWIFGVLEGLVVSTRDLPPMRHAHLSGEEKEGWRSETCQDISKIARLLLVEARAQLTAKAIYGQEYFREDGTWKYDIESLGQFYEESDVTFRIIASAHPLLLEWTSRVQDIASSFRLDLVYLKEP